VIRQTRVFLIFLAGCTATPTGPPAVGLTPDAGGLQPNGTELRIDFRRARAGVIAAVSKLKGEGPTGRMLREPCEEIVTWRDGLRLIFVDGGFVGWATDTGSAAVKSRCPVQNGAG